MKAERQWLIRHLVAKGNNWWLNYKKEQAKEKLKLNKNM